MWKTMSHSPCGSQPITHAMMVYSIPHSTSRMSSRQRRAYPQFSPWPQRGNNPTVSADHYQEAASAKARLAPIDKMDGLDTFEGRLVKDGLVFQQSFSIKSYEVGGDLKITVEALMNYMQETALNHFKCMGLHAGGFGRTPEMCRRNLIWAVRTTHISLHSYLSWGEVIDVKTWMYTSKRGMHREWMFCSSKTGETVVKAVSAFVVMNTNTRKLSTLADEILWETRPYSRSRDPFVHINEKKVRRMDTRRADRVKTSLTPMWNDLDANSHVSNVKYINWILEGVPLPILKKYVLDDVSLEYRRECGLDSRLQSLSTKVEDGIDQGISNEGMIRFDHLLLLQNGTEIARARTEWRPRCS